MNIALDRRRFLGLMGAAAALPAMSRFASADAPFNFQASWINDAEFSGYFIAVDKGFYREEGLNLNYISGGPDVIPESTIIAGKADLTLTTPDTTIKAIVEQGRLSRSSAPSIRRTLSALFRSPKPDQGAKGPDWQDAGCAAGQCHLGRSHAEDFGHRTFSGQHRSLRL